MSIENILSVWRRRDSIDESEGMVAYKRLHVSLSAQAELYGFPLRSTVAAFAALSPNNDYLGNMRSTITLLWGMKKGIPVSRLTTSTYNACRNRAWRALEGEDFLSFTKGKKTRNFYENILDPRNPVPVTIDGHMANVVTGVRVPLKTIAREGFDYDGIADQFREVAASVNILPNQLQAIAWFTWKRIHSIIYSPQLDMLKGDNQWGFGVDAPSLKPFPVKP